jgi:hypothetical protein
LPGRRLVLLLLLATCGAVPAAAQQWVEYRPHGAGYRVEFPGTPVTDGDEAAGTRYGAATTATANATTADGVAFYATHTNYPPGTAADEPQKVLDSVRLGRTAVGTVRSEQRFAVDGHLAQREIVDWHGPRPAVIVALDVTRGDWLYSIYCFAPPGLENGAAIARFLASFTLLPQ